MNPSELRTKVRESGVHNRCDLSRLFADRTAFAAAVAALAAPFRGERLTLVAGIESMGLCLAGAVARELASGVVMLRKPNKVAWTSRRAPYRDYKQEDGYLEVPSDAFQRDDRVLVIDDWTETGAQLAAAVALVESAGAAVAGIAVLNADSKARSCFAAKPYPLHSLFNYGDVDAGSP